jgi:ubiquinone/menaquinone biosynthesis C-methylase UbiE
MNGKFYDFVLAPFESVILGRLRADLIKRAKGKTLEIGFGTGRNFQYYSKNVELIGIEPDDSMRLVAQKRAEDFHFKIESGDAQLLSFSDETFDTVVATLVLCTVPNPEKAIKEVFRVLKPGGNFLLLEHVRRDTPVSGRILDWMTPLWKHLAGGCHLNRNPRKYLTESGFKIISEKTLWRELGKVWQLQRP